MDTMTPAERLAQYTEMRERYVSRHAAESRVNPDHTTDYSSAAFIQGLNRKIAYWKARTH